MMPTEQAHSVFPEELDHIRENQLSQTPANKAAMMMIVQAIHTGKASIRILGKRSAGNSISRKVKR